MSGNLRTSGKKTIRERGAEAAKKSKKGIQTANRGSGGGAPLVEDQRGRRMLRIRARLGMNREVFSRLLPISTRSLAGIESGAPPTPNVHRRLQEIERLVDALAEVVRKDAIGPWMAEPNKAFDGLKPIEVIERGEIDRIWEMIYLLRSGSPY